MLIEPFIIMSFPDGNGPSKLIHTGCWFGWSIPSMVALMFGSKTPLVHTMYAPLQWTWVWVGWILVSTDQLVLQMIRMGNLGEYTFLSKTEWNPIDLVWSNLSIGRIDVAHDWDLKVKYDLDGFTFKGYIYNYHVCRFVNPRGSSRYVVLSTMYSFAIESIWSSSRKLLSSG